MGINSVRREKKRGRILSKLSDTSKRCQHYKLNLLRLLGLYNSKLGGIEICVTSSHTFLRFNQMRSAIAYVRVSTQRQGDNGISLDAQMVQIRKFAEETGFKIKKIFREVGSGMGKKLGQNQPELWEAIEYSRKRRWPIIVAGFDRLSRNTATVEKYILNGELNVRSAIAGPDDNYAIIRSQTVRAQREGEEIGKRTKEGLARARARGAVFGNTVNLPAAQRKGAEANKVMAEQRSREFDKALSDALKNGASTAKEIASELNDAGYRTARDKPWTPENVYRARRQLSALELKETPNTEQTLEKAASIADGDLTPEELAWLERGLKDAEALF